MLRSRRIPSWALAFFLGAGAALVVSAFLPREAILPTPADRHVSYWLEVEAEGATPVSLGRQEVEYRAYVPLPRFSIRNQQIERAESSKIGVVLRVTNLNRDLVDPEGSFRWERWESPTTFTALVEVEENEATTVEFRDARPGEPVRFFVAGDPELNFALLDRFLEAARCDRPAFVWILGDLIQEEGWLCEEYLERFEAAEVPVFVTIGNHDLESDRKDPPFEARKEDFRRAFGPLHHAFEFRGTEYVVLDTSAPYVSEEQFVWLEGLLARDREKPRIVLTHKPFVDPRPGLSHGIEDPWDAERLGRLLAGAPNVVYYCGHIAGSYSYEVAGVPVRIVGSLTQGHMLERDEGGRHGFVIVRPGLPEPGEERVDLESPSRVAEVWAVASALGPEFAEERPEFAVGSAIVVVVLAALAGRLGGRWRRRRHFLAENT